MKVRGRRQGPSGHRPPSTQPELGQRLLRLAHRPHLPRRTVRLRLTVLYGLVFLLSGAAVLAVTNILVRRADSPQAAKFTVQKSGGGAVIGISGGVNGVRRAPTEGFAFGSGQGAAVKSPLTSHQAVALAQRLQPQLDLLQSRQLNQLLVYSAIALGAVAIVSMVLGWVIAGRALRPLRTFSQAARDISATNLHARLALDGPDDELKELGSTFNDLLARLEASFQAQRRFVANASHELRTPLARQRTLAEVALADPDASAETLRVAHQRVLASGAQQERLIEALLTLARGETGLSRWEPIDLAAVARGVLLVPPPEVQRLGLEVKTAIKPATVAGDPRLAERLVGNLVHNAVQHNVAAGRVEVSTGVKLGKAVLSVVNSGPVIATSDVERLFQPFQRLAPERTSHGDGVGLGLSIVAAIAHAHGAVVTTTALPEGGLAVEVAFPPMPAGDEPPTGADSPRSHVPSQPKGFDGRSAVPTSR